MDLSIATLPPQLTPTPVRLNELRVGDNARLLRAELQCDDCALLCALGLTDRCRFRVCKAGDPWIVQVYSTRIGLAASVADRILVIPEPRV